MVDPLIGAAAISALANIGGGIMSAGGAAAQNAAARDRMNMEMQMFNRQNDLNQWYFQKNFENNLYMSGSAYQRAMADMKAAGLNPVLAYQQGGASTNAGGMQSAASGHLSDPMPANPQAELGRGLARGVSSALEAATSIQQLDNLSANAAQTKAATEKTNVDTRKSEAEILKTLSETDLTKEQIKNAPLTRELLQGQTTSAYAAAGASSATAAYTGAQADKLKTTGTGITPGDLADTVEKVVRRFIGNTAGQPAPTKSPSPFDIPYTGPKNTPGTNWRDPNWQSPNKWWK